MTRDEFMTEAKAEIGAVANAYTNRIMNLIERAYAVGKRNAEIEAVTEIVKTALNRAEGEDAE